ncbi:MAG TPA: CHAP domain-containing protein [Candidatus Saccharimonadales bacterium]|nr:CHAP domain-containing protein [Candidatus Saccharimonadales bacterium]
MNPAVLTLGAVGISAKKTITLALATLALIVVLPCLAVFAMGAEVLTFLTGTPNAIAAERQGFYMGSAVAGDTYEWGNCTYWAFAMRFWANDPIPTTWGNANTWDDRARSDGYEVDHTPAVNAVFQSDSGDYGHVAYVTKVDTGTGDWTISEMNAPTLNVVTQRTFSKNAASYYNFIHGKKGAPEWKPSIISIPSLNTGI